MSGVWLRLTVVSKMVSTVVVEVCERRAGCHAGGVWAHREALHLGVGVPAHGLGVEGVGPELGRGRGLERVRNERRYGGRVRHGRGDGGDGLEPLRLAHLTKGVEKGRGEGRCKDSSNAQSEVQCPPVNSSSSSSPSVASPARPTGAAPRCRAWPAAAQTGTRRARRWTRAAPPAPPPPPSPRQRRRAPSAPAPRPVQRRARARKTCELKTANFDKNHDCRRRRRHSAIHHRRQPR